MLCAPELRGIVNPEVCQLLATSTNASFHAQDIWAGLLASLNFEVDSDRILMRPGILDFPALVGKLGRMGNFYAGYGPSDDAAWASFFESCATPGKGKNWDEVARLEVSGGPLTCGQHFGAMLKEYRRKLIADEDGVPSRVDDLVGSELPAFVATSVVTGDAVGAWKEARESYLIPKDYNFTVDFDDVKFGYWGRKAHLDAAAANPRGYADEKTRRFVPLGEATYREALSYSPAEPGLSRALELSATVLSAGGWPDLEPTLVLRNAGCGRVVLVTRSGGVSSFASSVARLLGMGDDAYAALYDLRAESAAKLSIEEADAVWCANWEGVHQGGGEELVGVEQFRVDFDDAYTAQLEVTDDAFFTGSDTKYGKIIARTGLPSCTAGVGPE